MYWFFFLSWLSHMVSLLFKWHKCSFPSLLSPYKSTWWKTKRMNLHITMYMIKWKLQNKIDCFIRIIDISYTLIFPSVVLGKINYQVSFTMVFVQLGNTENAFKYPLKTRLSGRYTLNSLVIKIGLKWSSIIFHHGG